MFSVCRRIYFGKSAGGMEYVIWMKIGPKRLLVFRTDLRKALAAIPAASNMAYGLTNPTGSNLYSRLGDMEHFKYANASKQILMLLAICLQESL